MGREILEQRCHYLHVQQCKNVLSAIYCNVLGPSQPADCPQHPNALAKGWVLRGSQARALAPACPHLSVGALSAASEHQCSRPYAISEDTRVNLAYSKSWLNRGLS